MIWFILAAAVAAGDLAIKKWIRENKDLNCQEPIAGGKIIITKYFNPGAMLGLLKEKAEVLTGISLIVVGMIIGMLMAFSGRKGNILLKMGLTLLLGGAASNVFERIAYGKVTDYFRISIGCKKLEKIIFNIGDFCIFAGSLMAAVGSCVRK